MSKWNFIKDIYDEVEFFVKRIEDFYYNIKNGIHNFIVWAPTIWKDRQFDEHYYYQILYRKLELMYKEFTEGKEIFVGQYKQAERIKLCMLLVKRICDDNYYFNALEPVERIYGKPDITKRYNDDGTISHIVEWGEKEHKARSRAYKHADYMFNQDTEMLYSILNKYSCRWWI